MATEYLASWACNLRYVDLPLDVVRAAVRTFYNWAGCAVGGCNNPATTIAITYSPPSLLAAPSLLAGYLIFSCICHLVRGIVALLWATIRLPARREQPLR